MKADYKILVSVAAVIFIVFSCCPSERTSLALNELAQCKKIPCSHFSPVTYECSEMYNAKIGAYKYMSCKNQSNVFVFNYGSVDEYRVIHYDMKGKVVKIDGYLIAGSEVLRDTSYTVKYFYNGGDILIVGQPEATYYVTSGKLLIYNQDTISGQFKLEQYDQNHLFPTADT